MGETSGVTQGPGSGAQGQAFRVTRFPSRLPRPEQAAPSALRPDDPAGVQARGQQVQLLPWDPRTPYYSLRLSSRMLLLAPGFSLGQSWLLWSFGEQTGVPFKHTHTHTRMKWGKLQECCPTHPKTKHAEFLQTDKHMMSNQMGNQIRH